MPMPPDPLVTALLSCGIEADRDGETDAIAARLSAVLAAARAVCAEYADPGLRGENYDPAEVCAVRRHGPMRPTASAARGCRRGPAAASAGRSGS